MQAIVNITPDWGIGSENRLLVHIRADMRRFRALTTNHTIIIGRKTLLTFPNQQPLANRENIILSHDPFFQIDNAIVCRDLFELKSALEGKDPDSVYVCGGESIYRLLLPYCSKALITRTETEVPADRFFPELNRDPDWILTDVGPLEQEGETRFRFLEYTNTNPKAL